MKKTYSGSVFRVVNVERNGYNYQSLESRDHRDVLQVDILNENQMIVEYGNWNDAMKETEGDVEDE